MNIESTYLTSDFGLAAALCTLGFELVGVDRQNIKRVVFKFRLSNDLNLNIEKFWARELYVDASSFQENSKRLKARIYQ